MRKLRHRKVKELAPAALTILIFELRNGGKEGNFSKVVTRMI